MNFDYALIWLPLLALAALLTPLLAALILRSACDLCGANPPPSYWRCLAVVVLLTAILTPLGLGAGFISGLLSTGMESQNVGGVLLITLVNLGFIAATVVITIATYMFALRLRFLKSLAVGLVNGLVSLLAYSVIGLIIVGSWTTVDAIRRLF